MSVWKLALMKSLSGALMSKAGIIGLVAAAEATLSRISAGGADDVGGGSLPKLKDIAGVETLLCSGEATVLCIGDDDLVANAEGMSDGDCKLPLLLCRFSRDTRLLASYGLARFFDRSAPLEPWPFFRFVAEPSGDSAPPTVQSSFEPNSVVAFCALTPVLL